MNSSVVERSWRAAYRAQQTSLLLSCVVGHQLLRKLTGWGEEADPAILGEIRHRYEALLRREEQNVEAGLYPRELLFQMPLGEYARQLPGLVRDIPRALRRAKRNDYADLPADVDVSRYPAYFRRTFHWQTDGYLSRRSARLYDLGVEFLFMGTADVMRRQVIPPFTEFVRSEGTSRPLRVLDVGCGTGRTLEQMAAAHPHHKYVGVELSPYYAERARTRLAGVTDASIVVENAESLPFRDGYFDAVVSVYLFHELPKAARRRVAQEMRRVLRPGGLLVVQDSAQVSDSPNLERLLRRFGQEFHEPFYDHYLGDDLGQLFSQAGFEIERQERCFVAKNVIGRAFDIAH
jgi:ubiquinone/menaquinone biosynthesis C-methylase UbiE